MPAALIWLVFALGLAGAEALTGDLFLIMLSGGALAAAGSSWLLDWPVWADGAVFLVVSVLLLALVRPALKRRILAGKGMLDPVKALEGTVPTDSSDSWFGYIATIDDGDSSNPEMAALGKAAAAMVEANRALWEARARRQRAKGWRPAEVVR